MPQSGGCVGLATHLCQRHCSSPHAKNQAPDTHFTSGHVATRYKSLRSHRIDGLAHGGSCADRIAQRSGGSGVHRRYGGNCGRIASSERPRLNSLSRHLADAAVNNLWMFTSYIHCGTHKECTHMFDVQTSQVACEHYSTRCIQT